MLSYIHRYHAGNFADVHKHIALIAVLQHFHKKNTSFGVLDAYAGEGLYDLHSSEIQKNKEYLQGYAHFLAHPRHSVPDSLIKKVEEIAHFYENHHHLKNESVALYPGSPAIISFYLRSQDRAIFTELHPKTYLALQSNLGPDSTSTNIKNINISKRDGLEAINAFLPFPEGRGLVFIDPSYELKSEYLSVAATLHKVYRKFSQGIYIIWYPILGSVAAAGYHQDLVQLLLELKNEKIQPVVWQSEWIPDPQATQGLIGSGLLVINPPWQFEQQLAPLPGCYL